MFELNDYVKTTHGLGCIVKVHKNEHNEPYFWGVQLERPTAKALEMMKSPAYQDGLFHFGAHQMTLINKGTIHEKAK